MIIDHKTPLATNFKPNQKELTLKNPLARWDSRSSPGRNRCGPESSGAKISQNNRSVVPSSA